CCQSIRAAYPGCASRVYSFSGVEPPESATVKGRLWLIASAAASRNRPVARSASSSASLAIVRVEKVKGSPPSAGGIGISGSSTGHLPQPAVTADQGIRRAVVGEIGWVGILQLRDDALGQHFAQLHAPLVERVDLPDRTLRENDVLVERHQRAEDFRRQRLRQ